MNGFYIVSKDGTETPVTKEKFLAASKSRSYNLYRQDGVYVLLHKQNPRATAAYIAHHNDVSNEWGKNDRLNRCLDNKGNICKQDCRHCDKERQSRVPVSLDERIEDFGFEAIDESVDVEIAVIAMILNTEINALLNQLKADERIILKALYGISDRPMTLGEFAEEMGLEYFVARNIRDRAIRRFRKIASHLENFLD